MGADARVDAPLTPARPARGPDWRVWARTLHLYASLVGVVLCLFFAATGFVLNHDDWFGLDARHEEALEGALPPALAAPGAAPLAVVEAARAGFDVRGALVVYEAEPDGLHLRFARPGEETDVHVALDGAARGTRVRRGALGVLTDLHKGDHSGRVGGLVVDAAAALLATISVTGVALWLAMPRRRRLGVAALALVAGLLAVAAAYVLG